MFGTLDEVDRLLSVADETGTLLALIQGARGRLPRFVEVVRSLLMEGLPIAPIGPLVQRYLANADNPIAEVAEDLRRAPAVRAQLIHDLPEWRVFLLAESYEATIRENIHREGDAEILALEPEVTQELLAGARRRVTFRQ
jgi:flagellar biosynthesis component FlhA